jgi:hypothetical protein
MNRIKKLPRQSIFTNEPSGPLANDRCAAGAMVGARIGRALLLAGLLLPPLSHASQSSTGHKSASANLSISLTVLPAFRVLEMTPVFGGHEYRVWTNMKTVQLNGQEYRFERIGETTLVVPGPPIEPPVLQSS